MEEKAKDESTHIDNRDKKIEDLTETLKRLQAEFENYKKRIEKDRIEYSRYASAGLMAKLLPVLDTFEIAIKNSSDKDQFIEGMKMIYGMLHTTLESEGLAPVETKGKKFDPYKHEVLMKEPSEYPDDTILEEFQKGYMLHDRVLRHSKVKICYNENENKENDLNDNSGGSK